MAYSEKYYHSYCAPNGAVCRISIQKKDYVGVISEIEGQPDPILINYESTEDFKFSPIRPSSAEVLMVFDTQLGVNFEEFWTADERDFKLIHTISGVIDWIGFVVPNGFAYELRGGKYYASIQCSDGLSTLQSINFWDENTLKPYGTQDLTYNNRTDKNEFPFILVLSEILRKLDLEINIWACIDSYEKTMTKTGDTRNADPLAMAFVNVKTYINDSQNKNIPYWKDVNEVWNSEEVLINLCYMFGAKVYQQGGVWRIKSINADVNYGTGITQRYWRKYNTLAVYLGYETINSLKTISCDNMIENDHTMSMGDVYKAFRMNYEYQFVREGDSPLQLLTNGNFTIFDNTLQWSAPFGWERYTSVYAQFGLPRLRDIILSDPNLPFTSGIEFGKQKAGLEKSTYAKPANYYSALIHKDLIPVNKGDKLFFDVWQKHLPRTSTFSPFYDVLYKLVITTTDGKLLYLGNNPSVTDLNGVQWSETECHFRFFSGMLKSGNYEPYVNKWRNFAVELEIPENGNLYFTIKGLTSDSGAWSNNSYRPLMTYMLIDSVAKLTRDQGKVIRGGWVDEGGVIPFLQIANVSLTKIPNPSDLASVQDFIYNNTNTNYSLIPDPVTVYNGDLQDIFHISNIIVPTNVSGGKNFWDTIDNKFGNSSLGLLTVRTIMSQYFKPFRIFEGTIKGDLLNFGDVFTFEVLPGLRFILQRGALNRKKGYIDNATFMQLLTDTLPVGGTESGNNTDPDWRPTGLTRCRKSGFLNDGWIEYQVSDVNQNSESYGQFDWLVGGYDFDAVTCPLGNPDGFYWGASTINSDYTGFNTYPVIWNTPEYPNTAIVDFDNSGGLYLYFLHLSALGVVSEVTTAVQGNIISDWQYLADVTLNGYLYRVLRINYPTADFTNLMVRFKFQ